MKKVFILFVFILGVLLAVDASGELSSEQVEKLVAAAWKEPPQSIDVTYYGITKKYTTTEQELRQIYEEAAEQMYGPKESLSESLLKRRDRMIQINVQGRLKEQTEGRKSKCQVRFDGDNYRIDKVYGSPSRILTNEEGEKESIPEKKLEGDTPFETTAIEIKEDNFYVRCEMSHTKRTAKIKTVESRQKFENSKLMSFTTMSANLFIKMKLGIKRNGSYERDEAKIEQLKLGTLGGININIQPDKDAPETRDKIELEFVNPSNKTTMKSTMICSRQDYSIVYSYEVRNPSTGNLIFERRAENFDSQGFPHNFIEIQYDNSGQVKFSEEFRIESVSLNKPIPSEAFEFSPPDYRVTDYRMTPAEQKETDIAYLKRQLKDEKPGRRFRALIELKDLTKDKPAELKEIATSMLDDEESNIREISAWILQSLESSQ